MRVTTLSHSLTEGWSAAFPTVSNPSRTLVLCFGAPEYRKSTDAFAELSASVGGAMIGCSTAGEIHGQEILDGTLSVAVAEFDRTDIERAVVPIDAHASFDAGVAVARSLQRPGLRAVFVLSDGLDVNGSDLVRGINSIVESGVVVTGGLAADGPDFKETWTIVDDKPASGYVTAVGLYGPAISIGHGSKGGWDKFGRERTVTLSKANVVYELDGRPILDLYQQYLGELAAELPSSGLLFPLALRVPGEGKQLVRTILGIDEEKRSMTFAGDVPQGHRVQLMQANFDRLVDGAEVAAESALTTAGASASLAIAISCVGRRLVLGERAEEELEATLHVLPDGVEQVGFYSYGEISPYVDDGSCDLHNQTMTLTTIAEIP